MVKLSQAAGDCGVGSLKTLVFRFRKWVLALSSCPGVIYSACRAGDRVSGDGTGFSRLPVVSVSRRSLCRAASPQLSCSAALRLGLPRLPGQAGPSKRGESPQSLPPSWESWIPCA